MIIAVYKKLGVTSRETVDVVKRAVNEKKIGHGGTLDPLAEGVLVIAIGRKYTKKLHTREFEEKEYVAKIRLGEKSSTDDREGEKVKKFSGKIPTIQEIERSLTRFQGKILQVPPAYSAIKVKGAPSYRFARKGILIQHKERPVVIKKIEILSYRFPLLSIKAVTGPGVYIRSLARDIGDCLVGSGYLYALLRTRVGKFTIEDCIKLKDININKNV